jgi:hypothetical protein
MGNSGFYNYRRQDHNHPYSLNRAEASDYPTEPQRGTGRSDTVAKVTCYYSLRIHRAALKPVSVGRPQVGSDIRYGLYSHLSGDEVGEVDPVHSRTRRHQLPTTEVLCRVLGFHGGDYEECSLLGCGAV